MSEPPACPAGLLSRVRIFLEMIKVSHSVFALPFALAAAVLAAGGLPAPLLLLKVILACILARTAAMSFNRWADRHIDAHNPRTAARAIPAGRLGAGGVLATAIVCAALFALTAAWIHGLALALSPVVLAVLFGYSYTKRFTQAAHLVLGAALGLAPLGAWVAVREEIALLPAILGLAVLLWTAGFDVIYACQDAAFDRAHGLWSLPRRQGIGPALRIARAFHAGAVALLAACGVMAGLGPIYFAGVALVAGLLIYEHTLVRADDLSRVDVAFFTLNGLVSLGFLATTAADVLVGGAGGLGR